jgi:hypothetical protein
MLRTSPVLPLTLFLAMAATGCGGDRASDTNGPAVPVDANQAGAGSPSIDPSATANGSAPSPSSLANTFTRDDMKTFVYGFEDSANLSAQAVALMTSTQSLSASLMAGDQEGGRTSARQVLDQANGLEESATAAGDRLRPLGPTDHTLIQARKDGLATFELTADYAGAATDVAEAVLAQEGKAPASIARQASSLLGTGGELTSAYAALTNELESWASANPSAAAKAIALYA